jgi:cobalt-zinc-cadmium resistance protein CzcA
VRSALIVAATIPFSLLFASILLNITNIPANLLSLGALDFGMVVDGSHCGHRTTLEAMERSSQPVIFSHSNPAALTPHGRNI